MMTLEEYEKCMHSPDKKDRQKMRRLELWASREYDKWRESEMVLEILRSTPAITKEATEEIIQKWRKRLPLKNLL